MQSSLTLAATSEATAHVAGMQRDFFGRETKNLCGDVAGAGGALRDLEANFSAIGRSTYPVQFIGSIGECDK